MGFNVNAYTAKEARLADAHDRNSVQLQPRGPCPAEQLWNELMAADDKNYVMSCWTVKDPPGGAAGRGASGDLIAGDGIVKGHAYSLISVDQYTADGQVWRVLRIRNPWGNNPAAEWKGALSDNWPYWPRYPQLREILKIGDAECDGMFWMPWDEFRNRFSDVGVAPKTMAVPRSGKLENGQGTTAIAGNAKHGKKFNKPRAGVPTITSLASVQAPVMQPAVQVVQQAPVAYAAHPMFAAPPAPTTVVAAAPPT